MIFVSESITTQITIYQCGCQAYTEDLSGGGEDLHRTGFYTSQTHRYVVQHLPNIIREENRQDNDSWGGTLHAFQLTG